MPRNGTARPVKETIENAQELASQGEGAIQVAIRLGFPSLNALERWLWRWDQYELFKELKRQDPPAIHDHIYKGYIADPVRQSRSA